MASAQTPIPSSKPRVLILDGGLGTTLEALPNPPEQNKYLWSSTPLLLEPSVLSDVHSKFIDAGANIIETATYQLSFPGVTFMDYRNDVEVVTYQRAKEVMRSAVTLARESADKGSKGKKSDGTGIGTGRRKAVALSLGPYGATMRPSTEYSAEYDSRHSTVQQLKAWHRERLIAFTEDEKCWKDIDYVAFETFGRCDEIRAVREVMTELFASGVRNKPFWISLVFPETCNGFLPSGETVNDAVEACLEVAFQHNGSEPEKPWGIGINCTKVSKLPVLIKNYEGAVNTVLAANEQWPALVLYPDGTKKNEHYDTKLQKWVGPDGKAVVDEEGKPWHEEVSEIVEETRQRSPWTAVVVGGCCRTGPREIGRLRGCLH